MRKLLLAILSMCCILLSCSKDNDTSPSDFSAKIVGTWWHYETYDTQYGDVFDHRTDRAIEQFATDGKWTRCEGDVIEKDGAYKVQGSKLILYDHNGQSFESVLDVTIIKITADYMELKYLYKSSGVIDDFPMINRYKRVLQ